METVKTFFMNKFLITILFLGVSSGCFSQQKKNTGKFNPPPVKTFLGIRTDTAYVEVEEASQLIGLPIKVKDNTGKEYKVKYYQFIYKRKDSVENFETGGVKVSFNTVGQSFYATPLPKIWVDNIRNRVKPGEEFYFFDILAEDSNNRNFYAPSLKILIK